MMEEESINYLVFPLRSICITKIAVQLWKRNEFKEKISQHTIKTDYLMTDENFLQISKKVSEKLQSLPLPNLLKENAEDAILPVGSGITKWISSFGNEFWDGNSKIKYIDTICFTNEGAVDKAKTIELHLDNQKIGDIFERACDYCVEEHIRYLWERMPKGKQDIYTENAFKGCYPFHLRAYWISLMKNELPRLMRCIRWGDWLRMYRIRRSINLNMFALSISRDNPLAAKYFWYMLTHKEKVENIVKFTNKHLSNKRGRLNTEPPDLMCFLLSQMDKEQQFEVFKEHSEIILKSLYLHFPYRMFFFVTIRSMWKYLGSDVYISILNTVLYDTKGSVTGKFFKEVWLSSPMDFKKHFIQHEKNVFSIYSLFEIKDTDSLNTIFNDANIDERKHIIFKMVKSKGLEIIYTGNLSLLQTLISKSMLSENEMKNLKENIVMKLGYEHCFVWGYKLKATEELLNWAFDSQEEVTKFKINLAEKIKGRSFFRTLEDWSAFKSVIKWCFNSDDVQINQFKVGLSSYDILTPIIWDLIIERHNFEFADKVLLWCFASEKQIEEFKDKFLLSEDYAETFIIMEMKYENEIFIQICKRDLIEQLINFFHPFESDVFDELKEAYIDLKNRYANVKSDANVQSFFVS